MAEEKKQPPIKTAVLRKQAYKMLEIYPLHIKHPGIFVPVENLDFSQQFNPSYNKESVYGRMDPIVTYSNTARTVRIGFSCQSHHYFDGTSGVIDNISTINLLTQMLYPAYDGVGGSQALLKAPPFFRIKYGQYFGSFGHDGSAGEGMTGIITNFSHGVGRTARNVAYGLSHDKNHVALPREIKVTFTFDVIHDKEVGWRDQGDKSIFSAEGYGSNFPYNTGVSSSPASKTESPQKTPTTQTVPAAGQPKNKGALGTATVPKSDSVVGAAAKVKNSRLKTIGKLHEGKKVILPKSKKHKKRPLGPMIALDKFND